MSKALLFLPLLLFSCITKPVKYKKEIPLSLHWELQDSLTDVSFRGISVPNENTVWVSGSKGTILHTLNGGISWISDTIAGYSYADFRDVEAFDSSTAIVMAIGNPAVILKTKDGGKSWNQVFYKKQDGIFLNSMTFLNDKNGFVVGDPVNGRFYLLRTTDGGETWDEFTENTRPQAKDGEYMFAASGTCITGIYPSDLWFVSGGSTARVFHSEDNGNHWVIKETPFMSGLTSTGIFSVLFTDDKTGYCIGGDYSRPDSTGITFTYTMDGGKTWLQPGRYPQGYRSCIKLFEPGGSPVLIAVGRGGSSFLKRSKLPGGDWKTLGDHGFYTLDTDPDGLVAWAAGSDGRVAKLIIQND